MEFRAQLERETELKTPEVAERQGARATTVFLSVPLCLLPRWASQLPQSLASRMSYPIFRSYYGNGHQEYLLKFTPRKEIHIPFSIPLKLWAFSKAGQRGIWGRGGFCLILFFFVSGLAASAFTLQPLSSLRRSEFLLQMVVLTAPTLVLSCLVPTDIFVSCHLKD